MAEISFEEKISGLATYYTALSDLEPREGNTNPVANPDYFYGGDSGAIGFMHQHRVILGSMARLGREEYMRRGFAEADIRREGSDELAERASILAVMTAETTTHPFTPEIRSERANHIVELLGMLSSARSLKVAEYNDDTREHEEPRLIRFDPGSPLYAFFRTSHWLESNLTVQQTFHPPVDLERKAPERPHASIKIPMDTLFREWGKTEIEEA